MAKRKDIFGKGFFKHEIRESRRRMCAVIHTYGIELFHKESKIIDICQKYSELTGEKFIGPNSSGWMYRFMVELFLSPGSKIYKGIDESLFKEPKKVYPPSKTNQKKSHIYRKYIRSIEWKVFADKIKESRGNKCEECGADRKDTILHAHHLTYERFMNELPEDIQVLCVPCHDKKHPEKHRRRVNKKPKVSQSLVIIDQTS